MEEVVIDGGEGEGGGQMLRTSLGLSLLTGRPFRLENVRARRSTPGLRRQHLTCVRAAAAVGDAEVSGDEIGSSSVSFRPRAVRAGEHAFAVGTAGSATLVLQTVLPALLRAEGASALVLEGGTDNPQAPSMDFLTHSYAPFVARAGASLALDVTRRGFYPAGGGRFEAKVAPVHALRFDDLVERGEVRAVSAIVHIAHLPTSIAHRMLHVARQRLGLDRDALVADDRTGSVGPGVSMEIHVALASHTEVITVVGVKGVSAEDVARECVDRADAFIASGVPVGEHLADQILLLAAVAGKGTFVTTEPTQHTRTQCEVIARFLDVRTRIERDGDRYAIGLD